LEPGEYARARKYGDVRLVTSVALLGELPVASGAIAVGDGFTGLSPAKPPSGAIPRGSYPVDVSLARYEDDGFCAAGDVRLAVARIRFSREPVVAWVESDVGAGVDSGTGGFADGDIGEAWPPDESESERIMAELDAASLGPSACGKRFELGGRVVFAFSSGIGDGSYDGYWGMDADGNPAAFCLDFDLLVRDVTLDVELALPLGRGAFDHPAFRAAGVEARVAWFDKNRLVITSKAGRLPFARWKCGDRYLRPTTKYGGRSVEVQLDARPANGVLVVRIVQGTEPMLPAPKPAGYR
jgi:hypothetical protein